MKECEESEKASEKIPVELNEKDLRSGLFQGSEGSELWGHFAYFT